MFTINDYLDDILEEFEDYVHSGIRLCDLKLSLIHISEPTRPY